MVNQCANPNCSKLFLYLREGRVFVFICRTQGARSSAAGSPVGESTIGSAEIARKLLFWCGAVKREYCSHPNGRTRCLGFSQADASRVFIEADSDELPGGRRRKTLSEQEDDMATATEGSFRAARPRQTIFQRSWR